MKKINLQTYTKNGVNFKVNKYTNNFTAILQDGSKGNGFTEEAALKCAKGFATIDKCANCKQPLNDKYLYLKFAGDNLHTFCLIDYLQRLRILQTVIPENAQADSVDIGIVIPNSNRKQSDL